MYTFLHRHCAQCAKNQCHTANISIERHVEAASCCYDGHQNGRGLYGCLPSNAGRSCNSLRQLRQARICRRISWVCVGFVLPYKGTKKAREMQIKMLLFSFPSAQVARHAPPPAPEHLRSARRYDIFTTFTRNVTTNFRLFSGLIWTYLDISGQKWTMAPATVVPLHRQSGTTRRRGRIYSSAKEKMPLGGAAENRPRPPSEGVKAKQKTQTKTRPKPGNGRA